MKIPFQTPVTLQSNLIQADMVMRLQEAVISRYAMFKSRSVYPVSGVVKQDRCSLEKRTFYNNSFQRTLNLRFEQRGSGTLLTGEFALRKPTLIFMTFWFGFLGVVCLIWTASLIHGGLHHLVSGPNDKPETTADRIMVFQPYLMVGFGWLLLKFGLWLSRRTEADTLRFLEQIASAQVVDPAMVQP